MTKPANTNKNDKNRPNKKTAGAQHEWLGESVEKTAPGSVTDEPEAAASRAEGHSPLSASAAQNQRQVASDPSTFDLSGDTDDASPDPDRDDDDDADGEDEESVEEKRQAAAEEHAEATSKHAPHGRL